VRVGGFISRILLGFASLVCSHAAFIVAHANGWFPDEQAARLLMASPDILQIEAVRWVLTAVLTVVVWALVDYFLYRRHSKRSEEASFGMVAGKLPAAMVGASRRDQSLERSTTSKTRDLALLENPERVKARPPYLKLKSLFDPTAGVLSPTDKVRRGKEELQKLYEKGLQGDSESYLVANESAQWLRQNARFAYASSVDFFEVLEFVDSRMDYLHEQFSNGNEGAGSSALKITFGNDAPYKYGRLRDLYAVKRTVCLRIENRGPKTLTGCRITIEHVEPPQHQFGWPITLVNELTLAPGQSESRELVNYGEALDRTKFNCADSFATLVLDKERPFFSVGEVMVMRLKATGVDTSAHHAQCRIWVDRDGKLQIQNEPF
jgi:hypothetical protein